MGKSKKEYREEVVESYSSNYTSEGSESDSDSSSGSSESVCSSGSNIERERRRKHVKRKASRTKKEKRIKRNASDGSEEEESEYEEREKRKRMKYMKQKDEMDERYTDNHNTRESRKHRSRKHKYHHRKHKRKHRHHRHHRSEDERSLDRHEQRRRDNTEDKRYKERRLEKDYEKKERREEKRPKERYEASKQVKSKWDEDEDVKFDLQQRIKTEPLDEEDSRGRGNRVDDDPRNRRFEREGKRERQEAESQQDIENGRPSWAGPENTGQNKTGKDEVQKPTMELSGKLAEDANTYNGVVIKYSQPPEARRPKRRWRWYIFKGDEDLPFLPLHRQSAYLIGRDRKVADIPTDHPSCSKQHAVLQYRLVTYEREDGKKGRTVKPYILDLESANGTYVNNRRIDPRRYVELIEKDVVKFGYSSREYILLHEGSKGDDDDIPDTGVEHDLSPVSLLRSK